jgi:hypothetical protein
MVTFTFGKMLLFYGADYENGTEAALFLGETYSMPK